MEELGYKHQGYTVGYDTMSQIRWLSVLNLKDKSEDQLLKEMDYQTRRNIKRLMKWVLKLKHYPLKKQIHFLNYSKWLKKNMALNSVKSLTLLRCKNL